MFPISLYNFCLRVVLSLLFFATASAARRSNRALNYLILVSICSLSVAPHQLNRAHPLYSVQDCCQIFSCSLRLFSHLILVIKSVLLSFLNTIASRLCWTSSPHLTMRIRTLWNLSVTTISVIKMIYINTVWKTIVSRFIWLIKISVACENLLKHNKADEMLAISEQDESSVMIISGQVISVFLTYVTLKRYYTSCE